MVAPIRKLKKRTHRYQPPLWAENYRAPACAATALLAWVREMKKRTQTGQRPRHRADSQMKKRTQLDPAPLWPGNYRAPACAATALLAWDSQMKKRTQTGGVNGPFSLTVVIAEKEKSEAARQKRLRLLLTHFNG
jgi:hypothetical protein